MFRLSSARRATELFQADKLAHLADIAVFKADALGARGNPQTLAQLSDLPVLDARDHDLERLGALPVGTFGRAYADFMRDNGLSPFILTDAVPAEVRQRNAFTVRYAATHDLFHVLLGFDTSWPGELGVLGFAVAQRYASFQRVAALLAFLVYPFLCGFNLRGLVRAWSRGQDLGRRARPILMMPLESLFERDLDQVRAELGLAVQVRPVAA